jgi:hypothetical protein
VHKHVTFNMQQHDIAATTDCAHQTANDTAPQVVIEGMDGMDDTTSMSITLKLGTHKELVQVRLVYLCACVQSECTSAQVHARHATDDLLYRVRERAVSLVQRVRQPDPLQPCRCARVYTAHSFSIDDAVAKR